MSIELRERTDAAGAAPTVLSADAKQLVAYITSGSSSEGNAMASYGDTPTDKVS
jgi:hypothetical protein